MKIDRSPLRPKLAKINPVQNVDALFEKDYFEARDTFRSYAQRFASHHPDAIVDKIDVANAENDNLTVDFMVLPAKKEAKRLLFISSGVHGAEAPTGSAMEEMFFRENLPDMDLEETTVIMLHSYNPWGHLHNFRAAEDNTDPNRNNLKQKSSFKNYPENEYHLVEDLMSADNPPPLSHAQTFVGVSAGLAATAACNNFDVQRVIEAMAEGQVDDPEGVLYAGDSYLPQRGPMMSKLAPYFDGVKKIAHFDIHTGLGERGVLHLINNSEPDDLRASRDFVAGLQSDMIKYADPDTPGFYDTSFGDFTNNSELLADQEAQVMTYTAEVGTLGNSVLSKLRTSARLKERSQLHFHPEESADDKTDAILDRTTELFDPQDESWRKQVVSNFRELWNLAEEFTRGE